MYIYINIYLLKGDTIIKQIEQKKQNKEVLEMFQTKKVA